LLYISIFDNVNSFDEAGLLSLQANQIIENGEGREEKK
jgi:hypothetical protein